MHLLFVIYSSKDVILKDIVNVETLNSQVINVIEKLITCTKTSSKCQVQSGEVNVAFLIPDFKTGRDEVLHQVSALVHADIVESLLVVTLLNLYISDVNNL
jgi:hypothetical protein